MTTESNQPAPGLEPPSESRGAAAMRARIAGRLGLGAEPVQSFGRYELERRIGAGGMGVVYSAHDPQLGRAVAIKVLRDRDDTASTEELLREARALARLSHPNVVQIHEVGVSDEGQAFVAMELVVGRTLFDWQRSEPRTWTELLDAYRQAGDGLAAAHAAGIVHRDFKASNAIIGDDGRVRVVDFGLAELPIESSDALADTRSSGRNQTLDTAGTPGYVAPELFAGRRAGPKADQFGFCVAMWEAITGERPPAFGIEPNRDASVCRRFAGPSWVRRALARGLQAEPGARWPDMASLQRALDRRPIRQRRLAVGLTAMGLVLGLCAELVVGLFDDHETDGSCAELAREVDEVWNPAIADKTRAQLLAVGRTKLEVGVFERSVDVQRQRWLDAVSELCPRGREAGIWSVARVQISAYCLEDRLDQLRALLELASGENGELPVSLRAAVAALDDPRACTDSSHLARYRADTVDEAVLFELRRELGRTRLSLAGETARGVRDSESLLARTRALAKLEPEDVAMQLALAEALELRASAEQLEQRPDRAWPLLSEAAASARRIGSPAVELRCLQRMAIIAADQLEQPERARDFVSLAASGLETFDAGPRARLRQSLAEAELARSEQRYADAEQLLVQAIELGEGADLPDSSLDRARLLLAHVIAEDGRLEQAVARYDEILASMRAQLGPQALELAFVEFGLGQTLHELGDTDSDGAEVHIRRAIELIEHNLGPGSVRLAGPLAKLAEIELHSGRFEQALADAERAWQLQRDVLPSSHGDFGQPLKIVAAVHLFRGDYERAHVAHTRLAEQLSEMPSEDRAALEHVRGWLSCRLGRCVEAGEHFEVALELTRDPVVRAYANLGLAEVEVAQQRPLSALRRLEDLGPVMATELADDVAAAAEREWLLARALVEAGESRARARSHLRRSREAYAEGFSPTPPDIDADLSELERILHVKQD